MSQNRLTLTYSSLSRWHACPRQYYWRIVRELVSETSPALRFGRLIHEALEALEARKPDSTWRDVLDGALPLRHHDPDQKRTHQIATAMLAEYETRYPRFSVLALEHEFCVPIHRPCSRWPSRSFELRGKVDALVNMPNGNMALVEHKTSGTISNGDHLEHLWHDLQLALYVHALRITGIKVTQVIYDVLSKPRIEQHPGESEEEFEVRRVGLKDPKRAKRRVPETDEEFGVRLAEWFTRPEAFGRIDVIMRQEHIERAIHALWDTTQQILFARSHGYPQNLTACVGRYGECPYAPICASEDSPMVIATYQHAPAHAELTTQENRNG